MSQYAREHPDEPIRPSGDLIAIATARRLAAAGDIATAWHSLRDLRSTKDAGLSDLAWSGHKQGDVTETELNDFIAELETWIAAHELPKTGTAALDGAIKESGTSAPKPSSALTDTDRINALFTLFGGYFASSPFFKLQSYFNDGRRGLDKFIKDNPSLLGK